jgi:hypothetical protein
VQVRRRYWLDLALRDGTMKHVKSVTVAKADFWSDIGNSFEDAWDRIGDFFKDLFD